ncbi:MAG: ABC transporter permease subunit [Burkholderiaceae bacterium]|nr:ABC transporter permease subunit [Burkholderiaceae bacterium]
MKRSTVKYSLLERGIADAGVLALVLAWYFAARSLPEYVLPGPQVVLQSVGALFADSSFLLYVAATLARVVVSILVAMVLGSALALWPHFVPSVGPIIHERVLPFFSAFPAIGWVLLAAIWFKVSAFTVLFAQVVILVPFCLINVSEGVRAFDREMLEMAESFTRRRDRLLVRILLPLLLPYLMAALRISYGVAWKIALVAELFGASSGLGFSMLQAQVNGDSAGVLANCLVIVALFVLGDRLVIGPLSRRFGGSNGE